VTFKKYLYPIHSLKMMISCIFHVLMSAFQDLGAKNVNNNVTAKLIICFYN